jgi:hypothetical protein
MRYLVETERVGPTHLDYGCGRGTDADHLNCDRYDPHYFPEKPVGPYDTITCSFVLNVIESAEEREAVLSDLRSLLTPDGVAYVTVRRDIKTEGYTSKGTYQETIHLEDEIVFECADYVIYAIRRGI